MLQHASFFSCGLYFVLYFAVAEHNGGPSKDFRCCAAEFFKANCCIVAVHTIVAQDFQRLTAGSPSDLPCPASPSFSTSVSRAMCTPVPFAIRLLSALVRRSVEVVLDALAMDERTTNAPLIMQTMVARISACNFLPTHSSNSVALWILPFLHRTNLDHGWCACAWRFLLPISPR